MDVRLPDGTVIQGVPDDITKDALVSKLKANGYDVSKLEERSAVAKAAEFLPSAALNVMRRFNAPYYDAVAAVADAAGAKDVAEYHRKLKADRYGGDAAQTVGNIGGDVLTGTLAAGALGGPLMASGPALSSVAPAAGRVVGGLGQAITTAGGRTGLTPATFAQRAGNMALRSVGGAAAGGAGAVATDSDYIGASAGIGAAVPVVGAAAGAAGRAVGSLARPFTESGRADIARRVLAESIADPAAVQRIAAQRASVAPLTTAEKAMDPGVSSLQRAMVNASKDFSDDLAIAQAKQNTARFQAMHGMSAGPNSPEALELARKVTTDPMLAAALQNASPVGTMGVRSAAKDIGQSPAFQRKAVRSAVKEAVEPFAMTGDDGAKQWARKVEFPVAWGARQNMDDISRGASQKVNDRAAKAAGAQLGMLRERLSTALEKASPDFKTYSREYAKMSAPVDAARTLQEMLKQATTGTADMLGNPVMSGAKLTNALKTIDAKDWARFSQQQRDAVQALARELQEAATAQTLAKAVGSNTVQNAVLQGNLPLAIRAGASWIPGGGLLSPVLDAALRGPSAQIQGLLGDALIDPAVATRLLSAPQQAPGLLAPALAESMRRAIPMFPGALGAPSAQALAESRR